MKDKLFYCQILEYIFRYLNTEISLIDLIENTLGLNDLITDKTYKIEFYKYWGQLEEISASDYENECKEKIDNSILPDFIKMTKNFI